MVHRHVHGMLLFDGILHCPILYTIILLYISVLLIYQTVGLGVSVTNHSLDTNTTDCHAIRHSMFISYARLF